MQRSTLNLSKVGVICCLAVALPAFAGKPHVVLQRTFDASPEQVFAAEVQAVGPTLKASVKEACMVNAETRVGNASMYRIIRWTITCHDDGNGKTTVTLMPQISSTMFGDAYGQDHDATLIWANFDAALKRIVATTAPSIVNPDSSNPKSPKIDADSFALVKLSSDPTGADLTVDDEYEGSTPSELKLKPGPHKIKITKKGFADWERSIITQSGEQRSLSANLDKAP
jgi:hypothetical protein